MISQILQPQAMRDKAVFGFFDDFEWLVTVHRWTTLVADTTPTVTVGDAAGGIAALYTDATDNNEVAVYTTKEIFLLAEDKPLFGEARVQFTEANTDDANICFGFANAWGANLLVDNGAGPKSSFSGALIYKIDGGTVWRVRSSVGTSYTDNITTITAGGAAYQTLRIEFHDYTSGLVQVTYFIDGIQLRDATTNLPIVHTIALGSTTEMNCGIYAKAGGSNAETLNCDYIGAFQVR